MSATGIGAAVRRKEDQRFITGKGHYTDDVNRPGQCCAYFLRSPHAHARIKAVDCAAAAKMPGVLAVLTGAELAGDKIGNLICGWMITSKDGTQMKMAPHPALAHGKANHVGDAVAVIVAETLAQAKDAAEKVSVDYEPLPAVTDPGKAQTEGAPQIHEIAARNTIYQWHLGDQKAAEAAFKAAHHVTRLDFINNRLAPNAIEPRAAIGEYDAGTDGLTLWNTTQNPHVARLVISAFVGIAPVGGAQNRPAGEMGVGPLGGVPHRRPWPRPCHSCRDGVRRRQQGHRPARQDHRQSRRVHVDVLVVGADLSLRHIAVRPV